MLLKEGLSNAAREQKIFDLSEHFNQTLPYDFGLKKPPSVDHLRRVKDKVKVMETISDVCIAEKCLINCLVSTL